MKLIKLFLPLILFVINGFGQVALHSTYHHDQMYHGRFENAGEKIIFIDEANDAIILYNLDQTIHKIIDVPPIFDNFQVSYLTEGLFDTDLSDFEYVLTYWEPINNNYKSQTYVFDEAQNQIFFRDSMSLVHSTANIDGLDEDYPVWKTMDGTLMRLTEDPGIFGNHKTEFYLLPGSLYCPPSCDSENFPDINTETHEERYSLSSSPNPASSVTKVFYDLPEGISRGTLIFYDLQGTEVKSFEVTDLFNYILVSTDNLPSGAYVYRMVTSKGISEGKKQVVVQ